jgi:hypothetical protein
MTENKQITTDELLTQIFKEPDPERLFEQNETAFSVASFSEYLNVWCKSHLEVPEHIIRRANLEKSYGHQLFTGKRNPSRDTVLQLAFAMDADYKQAQDMLKIARKSQLYPRIKRDAALIHCLHNRNSLMDAQILLQDLKLPLLGGRER